MSGARRIGDIPGPAKWDGATPMFGAEAQDHMPVAIRDQACSARPARLVWRKRRWRCVDANCKAKTWTETSPAVSARSMLTHRAGVEACRQVCMDSRPMAGLAASSGCAGGR